VAVPSAKNLDAFHFATSLRLACPFAFVAVKPNQPLLILSVALPLDSSQAPHNKPRLWHVEPGKPDFKVWSEDLYHFAQRIFR
jgi:hypothetical protein